MRTITWSGAITCVLLLAACGGQDGVPAAGAEVSMAAKGSAAEPKRLYPSKSGVIEWKTEGMGDVTTVVYFDDYGAKQASYTTASITIFGVTSTTGEVEITADGWVTKYNIEEKTGVRERVYAPTAMTISDFPDIEELKKLKAQGNPTPEVEELPARTILGREAKGYSVVTGGITMKGWIWENIPLRTEIDMSFASPMVMEATRVELGVAVPAEKFVVPADVVITEKDD